MLTINLYFSKEGIYYSFNGKNAKKAILKEGKKKKMPFDPISALKFRRIELLVRAGGDANGVSLILGFLGVSVRSLIEYLSNDKRLDEYKIRIIPCYTNEATTANISIKVFTSPALLIGAMAHTKKGVKNER